MLFPGMFPIIQFYDSCLKVDLEASDKALPGDMM